MGTGILFCEEIVEVCQELFGKELCFVLKVGDYFVIINEMWKLEIEKLSLMLLATD